MTVDLRGFAIQGSEVGVFESAIEVVPLTRNVVVMNGTVRNCNSHGLAMINATNSRVERIRAELNGGDGIRIGLNGLLVESNALDNGGHGFFLKEGSTIVDSVARGNGQHGIQIDLVGLVDSCVARSNTLDGIAVGRSTVRDSISSGNGGQGITAADSVVTGCLVSDNSLNGIWVGDSTVVRDNNIRFNTLDGIEVGALTTSCRIEGNHTSENGQIGIDVNGTDNVVVKNSSSTNVGGNYQISGGNTAGAISANPAAAGPWDNISN